jgi:hypothetical protein
MIRRAWGAGTAMAGLAGPKRTDKRLTLMADEPLSAVPRPEILVVPGGSARAR